VFRVEVEESIGGFGLAAAEIEFFPDGVAAEDVADERAACVLSLPRGQGE